MSRENVEVVRRAIESFEDDVDAWLGTLDPEIEWYPEEEGHTPARGYDAVLRVRERWLNTWERSSYRFDIEELTGRGENVMSTVYVTARGTGSGVQIEDRVYVHWKLRNGRIVYVYEYADRAEALEAAGLSE
jgi:ketosteroid isomerase-like protein